MSSTESTVRQKPVSAVLEVIDGSGSLSRIEKKALVRAVFEIRPLQFLLDLGKGSARYRAFLNRCLPGWVKCRGVYSSFAEARSNAPKKIRLGYDRDEIARGYQNQRFLLSDYPTACWLKEVLRDGSRVFDLGGSVGISFYLLEDFFEFPSKLEWTVCEVPAVAHAGEQIAIEKNERRLRFTSRFDEADGSDCLLASGSLQYIDASFAELLSALHRPPRHLIVNRIPLHPDRECVTLQNIRWAVSPYRIFQRDRFIADLEMLGYVLIDAWRVPDHSCWIPLYPEHSVSEYSGLYLRRSEP